MSFTQKTLAQEGGISGVGLHTGESCELRLKPAGVDAGLLFLREGRTAGHLSEESVTGLSASSQRCSAIGEGAARILTVEHLLAALVGCGITNLIVDVHGPEIPGLDGSALPFVRLFRELGIANQAETAPFYRIEEPLFCYDDKKAIAIYPAEAFSVSYLLDYDHSQLRDQLVDFTLSPGEFESQLAPARTFCTDREAVELQKKGFGLGADLSNTVIVAEDGSHRKGMRFPDECARHKILDLLGDLGLLGFPVLGRVVAIRSGHDLNRRLVQAIRKQKETNRG